MLMLRAPSGRQDADDDDAGTTIGERRRAGTASGVRRVPVLEVLVGVLDQQGRGLGLAGDVARDDLDRAELTERAGQG